jgi:hypothetical protein
MFSLGSIASMLAANLYQGNPDRNHKFWNIVSSEREILHMQVLLVHSSFTTYYRVCNLINTTGASSGGGNACPSRAPEFTPVFSGIRVAPFLAQATNTTETRIILRPLSALSLVECSSVKCFHCTHVFDLTNLKCEKRRNVGKLNNKLSIVNQLVVQRVEVVTK